MVRWLASLVHDAAKAADEADGARLACTMSSLRSAGTNVRQELAADPSRRSKTAVTADSYGILVYQLCQIR